MLTTLTEGLERTNCSVTYEPGRDQGGGPPQEIKASCVCVCLHSMWLCSCACMCARICACGMCLRVPMQFYETSLYLGCLNTQACSIAPESSYLPAGPGQWSTCMRKCRRQGSDGSVELWVKVQGRHARGAAWGRRENRGTLMWSSQSSTEAPPNTCS